MELKFVFLSLFTFALIAHGAKIRNRVIQGEKLSEKEHFHAEGEDESFHDADYDHEAFLGRDEAHEFDQLSPGEPFLKSSSRWSIG